MLLDAIGWVVFGFGAVRLAVGCVNLFSRPYLCRRAAAQHGTDIPKKSVSVLIPVRNEAKNIPLLLDDLSAYYDDAVAEIIVYDDRSDDSTADLVRGLAEHDPRIVLICGGELPDGWTGKNHACYVLSEAASADMLLFLDADVRLHPQAVSRAAAAMTEMNIGLLSIFPVQLMNNTGTRISVPIMNWILLSLLPLVAVRRMPQPSLAAANGQFMLFRTSVYRSLQPHLQFKNTPDEDMAVVSDFKRQGIAVATLLGRHDVDCRMYDSLGEAVSGFSKNVFRFFGDNVVVAFAFAAATTIAPLWIFLFNGWIAGCIYLSIIILLRIVVSLASRQNVFLNIVLMPLQQTVFWIILCRAYSARKNKFLTWKGRNIYS